MRCIHLDFHTSPLIEHIGKDFNREEYIQTIKNAKIDSMTVFAKCHHGYCYYPTKIGKMHPHLSFDLLGAQLEAIRAAGAKAPVYITMGWCKKDADEHPEWRQVDFGGKTSYEKGLVGDSEAPIYHCAWERLCPVGAYKEHLVAITHEICKMYDVSDGIMYDICFMGDACVCDDCRKEMKKRGLTPESLDDARTYYRDARISLMKELTGIIQSYYPSANVFYNGGANQNRPEYHAYQTHFELEDLPTAWGGYDFMPLRAKFFERYGKFFLGMTGKFHHAWGEFGGFKNKDALRYECADMVSLGASISVGDHLHPLGKLDASTYAVIGHAFDYAEKIEKYSENTRAYTDLAIWMSHSEADIGCSKLLQCMHLEYDVLDTGDDPSSYKCIILPDAVCLSDEDKARLVSFAKTGGTLIVSGASAFDELGIHLLGRSPYDADFIECPVDEIVTPFLSYTSAFIAECEGEVLARVREPYFSRTYAHFCGHKNTPYKEECACSPALVRNGNILYFAHPVFTAYNTSGSYVLQRYIKSAIGKVYDKPIAFSYYPSSGRIRIRKGKDARFYALHLLYAPPVNRGNVCLLEDFPPLFDTHVSVRIPERVKSVRVEPAGESLAFSQKDGILSFAVPKIQLHALIVIEY